LETRTSGHVESCGFEQSAKLTDI